MARPRWLLFTVLVFAVVGTGSAALAQGTKGKAADTKTGKAVDADPGKTAATLMLTKGWDKSKSAKDLVKKQNLKDPPLKDDWRPLAAHWLVLMYQGENSFALDSLKVHLAKSPTNADLLRAEIWIRMVEKDYGKAMAAAQLLAQTNAPQQPAGGKPAAPLSDEIVRFLGHVCGFLAGPANLANDPQRKNFEAYVLDRLTDAQWEQFKDGRDEVFKAYRNMLEQAGAIKAGAQQGIAEAQKPKPEFNQKDAELKKKKDQADAEVQKANVELLRKKASLDTEGEKLLQTWRRLKSDSEMLNTQIQQFQEQVNRYQQIAADSKNPQQNQAAIDLNLAQRELQQRKDRLSLIPGEIFNIENAYQRLVDQGMRNELRAAIAGEQIGGQRGRIDDEIRKNANAAKVDEEKRAAAEAKALAEAGQGATLSEEALKFSTYDRFPFANVKTKLLKALE